MSKIKVSIVDNATLKLEQDAKKGDLIDLNEVNQIDMTILLDKIAAKEDEVYLQKLLESEERHEQKTKLAVSEALREVEKANIKLQEELKGIVKKTQDEISLQFIKEQSETDKNHLQAVNELRNKLDKTVLEKDNAFEKQMNQARNEIFILQSNLKTTKENEAMKIELELSKQKEKSTEELNLAKNEIAQLNLTKSSLNVKKLGERLEQWCDNEYENQALSGFENADWSKDNKVVRAEGETRGTKADYLFKLYAKPGKQKELLLTSAVLEMKSELPNSTNRQTNASFYKKLDDDRNKKNCEYAVLVSELEWEIENDVPIRKVHEYKKMYVVRPQYFMTFLNLITAFGLKYQEILLEKELKRLEFEDVENILKAFEEMKQDVLKGALTYIEKQSGEIIKQSNTIKTANDKILESANKILTSYVETVKNKIDGFKIEQITNKIENLSEDGKK